MHPGAGGDLDARAPQWPRAAAAGRPGRPWGPDSRWPVTPGPVTRALGAPVTRTPGPAALALAVEISATGSLPLPAPAAGSTPPWPGPSYPRPSVNARATGQCDAGHWHRTLPHRVPALVAVAAGSAGQENPQ